MLEAVDGDSAAQPPEDFQDLVRDALLHLHDPAGLQVHPLRSALAGTPRDASSRGRTLYRALLGAVESLRPAPGTPPESRAWRHYRVIEMRYIDGREVGEILDEVALSKNQYHRDHRRALRAISSLLWDSWQLDGQWPSARDLPEGGEPNEPARDLGRREADSLRGDGRQGRIRPAEVIGSVAALLAPLYAQRGVDFDLSIPESLPSLPGDRVALRHALIAILTHALKESGVRAVHLVTTDAPDRLEIAITLRIEASAVSTEQHEGESIAVGVSESRPFVESLAGWIVTSVRPDCLEVSLALPLGSRARPTLLVVDNSPDFARLVERYLAAENWSVQSAMDVDSALAIIECEPVSAVLLDIVLPGRDGWDLLQLMKANQAMSRVPVIVCSVFSEPEIALSLGAAGYLAKPIARRQLIDALAACQSAADDPSRVSGDEGS